MTVMCLTYHNVCCDFDPQTDIFLYTLSKLSYLIKIHSQLYQVFFLKAALTGSSKRTGDITSRGRFHVKL